MLTFDDGSHKYFWNGKHVPNVTSILEILHNFDSVPADVLQAASERGTAVHLACEYWDRGILDESTVDESIVGYLEGWKSFLKDTNPQWSMIEAQFYSEAFGYAGTLDRKGQIFGCEATLDIKTSVASHPVWGVQTAAYSNGLKSPKDKRFTVQLRDNGTYRLNEWKDSTDWSVFVSLLTVNNFLRKHS